MKQEARILITKDGPYLVSGNVPLAKEISIRDKRNVPTIWKLGGRFPDQESYALCRCGASKNKPFCDGSHSDIEFDGTETASKQPYTEVAERYEGAELDLLDQPELCAGAQFCHRAGGIWDFVEIATDPKAIQLAIEIAGQCPSGRLVVCEKGTESSIEPQFEKTITVLEDPGRQCSGPLWVKGGIPIHSSDGTEYEVRNRVTLCRCGESNNKPFCDGTHIDIGFKDSD
ncbi:MAG: CDGSH iron-sulfur domain-containing protein [Euryarchaeota archaeon]|nr:CDGSH iron-sulfur domain-containing protein [Euryarchaeota archaeon]